MPSIALIRHPSTPSAAVRRVAVRVRRTRANALALVYVIEGKIERVRLPPPCPSRRADELWRHTCCEAFLAGRGQTGYYEYNFAPSTEWAVYRFTAYREGMAAVDKAEPLRIAPRVRLDRIALSAIVDPGVSPHLAGADWRLAASAIIEETDGHRSYWALRHPPGRPDFHHPDGFALVLDRSAPVAARARRQD
ncbi:MAG TPA: DOMON-like domain-containing protein [Candidatus Competibacter sp.]|nr:DOMON-like domain-containing protein [Candidatus Competibacter sp.]